MRRLLWLVLLVAPALYGQVTITSLRPLMDAVGCFVTTASLPGATLGTPYSQSLASSGCTAPTTWTLDAGTLPFGLSLSTGGVISGTPTGAGPISFTVRVTDAVSSTATHALSIFVGPFSVTLGGAAAIGGTAVVH